MVETESFPSHKVKGKRWQCNTEAFLSEGQPIHSRKSFRLTAKKATITEPERLPLSV